MLLSYRRGVVWTLIWALVLAPELATAQQPAATKQAARRAALKLIPKEAAVGLIGHPRAAMLSPAMEMLPIEIISAAGKQKLGFDPLDVEVVVGALEMTAAAPQAAVVLRLRQPLQLDALPNAVKLNTTEETYRGKPYLRSQPGGLSLYLPNEKTLFIGTDGMIEKMLAQSGDASVTLHQHLGSGDASDLQVVVVLDPLRPLIDAQLAQIPFLPGALERLKTIPAATEAVEVRVGLAEGFRGELALHANDAAAAEQIEQAIEGGLNMAKQFALMQVEQSMASENEEIAQASKAYAQRMADMIADKIRPGLEGTTLTMGGDVGGEANVMVISTLVALLLPAVQAAREAARRANASNQLRQLMLSLLNFESATRRFPAHAIYGKDGKPLLSWRVAVLPYLEENALYEEFHLDEPWDSEHNKKLIERMPAVFEHPGGGEPGKTHYVGLVGDGLFFGGDAQGRQLHEILDGTSKSICIVEADDAVIWSKPADLAFNLEDPLKGLGGLRAGNIFMAAFVDGHVLAISQQIDEAVIKAMATIAGGERVD